MQTQYTPEQIAKINDRIDSMKAICGDGKREIKELVGELIGAPVTPPLPKIESGQYWKPSRASNLPVIVIRFDGKNEFFAVDGPGMLRRIWTELSETDVAGKLSAQNYTVSGRFNISG